MEIIIDRFEGDYAVVEMSDMTMANMPISLIPEGAKEGDVLTISIDKTKTEKRKRRMEKLMNDLWEE
jgi:hypothetical protein